MNVCIINLIIFITVVMGFKYNLGFLVSYGNKFYVRIQSLKLELVFIERCFYVQMIFVFKVLEF